MTRGDDEMDREKVIEALETCRDQDNPPGYRFTSCKDDCPYSGNGCARRLKEDALALLKEQEEQKRKWLQTIADTQLAISPTGYESEDEMAKRGWEWNGLQMAWEIIAGEERSEHPRLVRCKDCKQGEQSVLPNRHLWCRIHEFYREPEWFCADGEKSD